MFVEDEGTGRSMLDVEGFSLSVRGLKSVEIAFIEYDRRWELVRLYRPLRDGGGGASPNMKNLMKAPISRTTDSWPTRRPCVKERLYQKLLEGLERPYR